MGEGRDRPAPRRSKSRHSLMGRQGMIDNAADQRLSWIQTSWTKIEEAHRGRPEQQKAARDWLVERYWRPARRYLLAILAKCDGLHNQTDLADDLADDFVNKLLAGKFHGAERGEGSFRHYIKKSLRNLIRDHLRRDRNRPEHLTGEGEIPDSDLELPEEEAVAIWRQELIAQAFRQLADREGPEPGRHLVQVLTLRRENE